MTRAAICLVKHLHSKSPLAAYRTELSGDVEELVNGGMDRDAAWLEVIDQKLTNLDAEKTRIEQLVADAYAKTAAGKAATAAKEVQQPQKPEEPPEGLVTIPADEDAFAAAINHAVDATTSEPGQFDAQAQGKGDRARLAATFGPAEKPVSLPRTPDGVELITPDQAAKKLAEWKAEAERQGTEFAGKNGMRTVISLFDASGVLAQPWVDAGYQVYAYDLQTGADINEFSAENLLEQHGNDDVWAILAQPPCTDFASSGARWWKDKDANGRTEASNELVRQVLRTVELFRPSVWVMENPVGRIAKLNKLPTPTLSFDPWNFGDPYTKRTLLWGRFDPALPTAMVDPTEGSKIVKLSSSAKFERSLTPEGFSYALFMANNAEAMPVYKQLAAEFAGVEPDLFRAAIEAGAKPYDIKHQIEDAYYDNDLEYVRAELEQLAKGRDDPASVDNSASRIGQQEIAQAVEPSSKPAKPGAVENFGEALPPARRHSVPSLDASLSDDEIASQPLSQIWPQSENEAIEDTFAAAVAHAARAEIPAKPRKGYKLHRWVNKVSEVRALAQMVTSGAVDREDFAQQARSFGLLGNFLTKVSLLESIDRGNWKRIGEVHGNLQTTKWEDGEQNIALAVAVAIDGKDIWFAQGGTVADNLDAIQKSLGQAPVDKRMQFEVRGSGDSFFINKKGDPLYRRLMVFITAKEAIEAKRSRYEDLIKAWEVVKDRDNVNERDLRSDENRDRAGQDWRQGKDITADDFVSTFGFRGGEFGKWVGQGTGARERQWMLNRAYDALMDLSKITGIAPKALSLNGTLGLAFGSRGTGWASAHFEPSNLVINLTKTRGAGALAHEWFHALDNYFARQRGGEVAFSGDQDAYRRDNYITHKPEPVMVNRANPRQQVTRTALEAARAKHPTNKLYAPENWMPSPTHPEGVRPEVEERFAALVEVLDASPMSARSKLVDKGKQGYWSQALERAARAFEVYAIAKMAQTGGHNEYLANVVPIADFARAAERYPYPTLEELKPIADALDALFSTVKVRADAVGNLAVYEPASGYNIGGAVALAESKVYSVVHEGQNRDLFDSNDEVPLPAAAGTPGGGPRRPSTRGRDVSAAATILAIRQDPAMPGIYHVNSELIEVGRRDLPVSKIKSWSDAANALQALQRYAVEHVDVLITDAVGKPLAIVGSFKGAISQAAAYPSTILAEALRIEGAAQAWGVHNHPAGSPVLSRADEHLSASLSAVFDPSTVKWMGIAAVAGNKWMSYDGKHHSGSLTVGGAKVSVPIVERTISMADEGLGVVDSPIAAKALVASVSQGQPGIVFFNNAHRITAWIPFNAVNVAQAANLRMGGHFDRLINSTSQAGAAAAIIVNPQGIFKPSVVRNLINALGKVDVQVLDEIDPISGRSSAENGGSMSPESAVYSRSVGTGPGVSMSDAKAFVDAARNILTSAPEFVLLESIDAAPPELADQIREAGAENDVEAAYFEGQIFVWPAHVESMDRLAFVVGHHEIRHHGLREILGDRRGAVMTSMWQSNPKLRAQAQAIMDQGHASNKATAIEEALADMPVEELIKLNGWDRIVAAVRQWMRNLGEKLREQHPMLADLISPDGWTDRDIAAMVLRAEGVSRGKPSVYSFGQALYARRAAQPEGVEVPRSIDRVADSIRAMEQAKSQIFGTNRELKMLLQGAVQQAAADAGVNVGEFSVETEKYLVRVVTSEAARAIREHANAIGWYQEKVTKALRIIGLVHPEINTDPESKFAFIWALAVTSNGIKVDKNFEMAEAAYAGWKASGGKIGGSFPTGLGQGTAASKINAGLAAYAPLIARHGFVELQRMMDTTATVSQIAQTIGIKPSGEDAGTIVYGSAILGPKVGNGFFANLYGHYEQLTIDRWLMRTWGRLTGTLVQVDPLEVATKTDKLAALVKMLTPHQRARIEAIIKMPIDDANMDSLSKAIFRASSKEENRILLGRTGTLSKSTQTRIERILGPAKAGSPRTALGDEIRKMGIGLLKANDGQQEIPRGPWQRNQMRKVFSQVLEALQNDHPDLTMSDLQAVLWYPEKRIYETAKIEESSDDQEGYSDTAAPDYANAAAKHAAKLGVAQSDIDRVTRQVDSEKLSAGNGPGSARRNARGVGGQAQTQSQPEAVTPAGAMFSRPRSPASSPASALVSGLKNLGDVKLAAGYVVNDFLESNGKLSWWHKTVGTMTNLAKRNPLFAPVYDAANRFLNDVSTYATEAADLAPTLLPKLEKMRDIFKTGISAQDTTAIQAPLFEGTLSWTRDAAGVPVREADPQKAGIVWTKAELRTKFGLDDRQIGLYREARAAVDKSLTDLSISDMIRFGGKDVQAVAQQARDSSDVARARDILTAHIAGLVNTDPDRAGVLLSTGSTIGDKAGHAFEMMRKGYFPLMRFGHFTVDVVDAGKREFFRMFETQSEANRAARQLRAAFPNAEIKKGTMSETAYQMFAGVNPETLELFGEMLGLESTGTDAASQAFQEYLKLTKSNRSSMKRLIERKGMAGYSEDAGRVLAGFVYSNARQASKNLHLGGLARSVTDIRDAKGEGELLDAAQDLYNYVANPMPEAPKLKALLFAQFLGGSLASAAVNLTQPLMVTFPFLSQYGGAAKAARVLKDAYPDALKWASGKSTGDAALDAALKKAEEEGVLSPQEVHNLIAQSAGAGALRSGDGTKFGDAAAAASNWTSKLMLAWGRPFALAEQFNRQATFIASWRTAIDQGMADPFQFAERTVEETQFVYTKANRPAWARGAVGSVLFTFKSFSISYVELLTRLAQSGPEGKKAALLALAMLFLMSGMQGLPGADDLDDLIDGLMQRLGYNFNSAVAKREFFAGIVGEGGAHFLARGVSSLPGMPIDVAGRLGMGNLIPATGLFPKKTDYTQDVTEVLGPAGSLAKGWLQAANQLTQGEFGKAAILMMPLAGQNLYKGYDMATTGVYHDQRGRKVLDVDGYEALVKSIGFQPTSVARVQGAAREVQELIGLNKMRETEIADKWAKAIFNKDEPAKVAARQEVSDWNTANPDSPIRISTAQLLKRIKAMRETKVQRIEKTAPKEMRATVRREIAEAL